MDIKNLQMKHPKARNELPEQVRTRIEEARKKVKKQDGISTENDNSCHYNEKTKLRSDLTAAFPDFPDLALSILRT
jgi:hypothetical protein